jgi:hypothetical protein
LKHGKTDAHAEQCAKETDAYAQGAHQLLMYMLSERNSIKRLEHARKEVNIFNNFLTT